MASLQNGVDNAERLRAVLSQPVFAAAVYLGAYMNGPGIVRHTGRGDLVLGASRADAARPVPLRFRVAPGLAEIGLGPLSIGPLVQPDANSHHHMGTTRMGADAQTGVTDVHGQVFGTDNLFVAGASVFPAAGFANPTLTSIALSLRLARWLKGGTA